MATLTATKSYTLVLSEIEAAVLLGLTTVVHGDVEALGGREVDEICRALIDLEVVAIVPKSGRVVWKEYGEQ